MESRIPGVGVHNSAQDTLNLANDWNRNPLSPMTRNLESSHRCNLDSRVSGRFAIKRKSFRCIMKSICGEVVKSFHCIKKLKTASKFAVVHLRWLVLVFSLGESIARASHSTLYARDKEKQKW